MVLLLKSHCPISIFSGLGVDGLSLGILDTASKLFNEMVLNSVSKNLVSKKVSDSVLEKFGIKQKFRIRLGIVTHCLKVCTENKQSAINALVNTGMMTVSRQSNHTKDPFETAMDDNELGSGISPW